MRLYQSKCRSETTQLMEIPVVSLKTKESSSTKDDLLACGFFLKRSQCSFWKWASTRLFKLSIVIICLEILTKFLLIFFHYLKYQIFQYSILQMASRYANFLGFCHMLAFLKKIHFIHYILLLGAYVWRDPGFTCAFSSYMKNSSKILPCLVLNGHIVFMPCRAKHVQVTGPHGASGWSVQ